MTAACPPVAAVAGAAVGITSLVAVAVVVTGGRPAARDYFALPFPGPSRQGGEVAQIAAHNGRYALGVMLACLAVQAAPLMRPVLDVVLAGLLGLNAGLIGLAWGAYGTQLLRALILHGTVELAAFAVCGGAYLRARRDRLPVRDLALAAVGCAVLLIAAAGVETYVSLEADRA